MAAEDMASTSSASTAPSASKVTTCSTHCWSPLSVAAIDMAVCGWYGLNYYSVLAADVAAMAAVHSAAAANYDQQQQPATRSSRKRKVDIPSSSCCTTTSKESTTTRLQLFDRRGRVTFKPYSDIRLDSSLKSRARDCLLGGPPLKKRQGDFLRTVPGCSNFGFGRQKGLSGVLAKTQIIQQDRTDCTIGNLFPEILSIIFEYLDIQSKGRVAQVSTRWKDAAYKKSVWKGLEARLHLNRSNPTLFPSLVRRGIKDVQVLSLRKSPRELVNGIPNIESLNLSGCYNLSDPNLEWAFIKEVSSLTKLNLSLCKEVTDNSLGRIATNCKNLQDLDLAGCCKITNAGIFSLSWGLKKLKRLNLRSCRQISDQGIGHLTGTTAADLQAAGLGGSPTLEELSLQDCQKLTDESLRYVSEGLPNLRSLNLSFCVSITDTGLKSLAKMTSLEAVNLRSCDNVSDIGLGFLAAAEQQQEQNNQRKLVKLDVSFCGNVTDASLRHIASGLAGLQNLSMTTCAITDEGLVRLAASAGLANSLKELNIGQCVSVSDEGLEAVGKTMKQLQIIDLYGCPNVTEAGISSIKAHLPKLTKLNLSL